MFNNCIKIPHDWQHKQRCSHRILPRDLCRALRSAYSFSSVNCRRCSSCTDIATMQPHSPDSSHLTVSVILLAGCREAASASISVTQWPTISILHPVGKKLYVGSKIDWHLSEWARRHLSPCKVWGEIEQCAPAVAAKIWCMYVFLSRSKAGALFIRGGRTLNKYCVMIYGLIFMLFSQFFSE